jgi:hypothetical protein
MQSNHPRVFENEEFGLVNLDSLIPFPGAINMETEFADGGDVQGEDGRSEAAEDIDEQAMEREEEAVVQRLAAVDLDPDLSESVNQLPPARNLIHRVETGIQRQITGVEPESDILPSVSVLIDTVNGRINAQTPAFNFFHAGFNAAHPPPDQRVALGQGPRYFKDFEIAQELVVSLNEGRLWHVFCKIIQNVRHFD